jgi:hypothetical protein
MKLPRLRALVVMLPMAAIGAEPVPRVEFAFEERVTLSPTVEMGETALGARRFIPITGGTVAGPKLTGVVQPGGWDFQLTYAASHCTQLSADYFLKAEEGTLIHVFNEGLVCPEGPRAMFRPKLEAPQGKYQWMTHSTFVATLELEYSAGSDKKVEAVRIRFYQVL